MRNSTAPLLYFILKTAPFVWIYLVINLVLALFTNCLHGAESSGINAILGGSWMTPYLAMMMGLFFYTESKPGARPASMVPLPYGEFLLSRPVTRRGAWIARASVCYAVMLAVPLLDLCLALLKPDMRFLLFHNHGMSTEAADKLPQYLALFPGSTVIHDSAHDKDTLIAPWGYVLFAGAQFLFTAIAALVLQSLALSTLPPKLKYGLFLGATIAVIFAFLVNNIAENCFFIFAQHWFILTSLILALILAAQYLACKTVSKAEIV